MGNIVRLDDSTINKIAAGEVIERPASVIKEMCENSIDAGANNITIEIRNGGISYIRITDNGSGIEKDDMEIAFERHATSKIRVAEDLVRVKSMGFRGEALASVAAISKVEMTSRTASSDIGYKIVVEGGKVIEFTEVGCPVGTTIVVRNLFYNTPVRYKFLKKDYTESGYIEDAVAKIALSNPNVAIRYVNTGKTVIQTQGSNDLKSIVYSIYGKDVADGVLEVNYNYDNMKVTGVIGRPEIARSNRSNQIFFVNRRNVKDKTLTAATEQAYKGLLPIGKFAFAVLNIEMDQSKVDVNVHPAKLEVRFEEENQVFKAIYNAIKDTLAKIELEENINNKIQNVFAAQKQEFENERTKEDIVNKDINFSNEIKNEYEDSYDDYKEHKGKESRGLAGFIKRIHKEPEDDFDDESNHNSLQEIYEFRNELKRIGVAPVSSANVGFNPELAAPVQEPKLDAQEVKENIETESNTVNMSNVIVEDEFGMSKHENVDDFIKETNEKAKNIIESYYQNNKKSYSKTDYSAPRPVQSSTSINTNSEVSSYSNSSISNDNVSNYTSNNIEAKYDTQLNNIDNVGQNTAPINSFIDNQATMQLVNRTMPNIELLQNEVKSDINVGFANTQKPASEVKPEVNGLNNIETPVVVKEDSKPVATTDNVTQKLMENIEFNDRDRTQIIDTNQIRNAIQEIRNTDRSSNFDEMYSKVFGKPPIQENENSENNIQNEKIEDAISAVPDIMQAIDNTVENPETNTEEIAEEIKEEKVETSVEESKDVQPVESAKGENLSIFENDENIKPESSNYRFIGRALEDYVIIELKNEMYIINEKFACKKIIYEKVNFDFNHYNPNNMQSLLIPDVITLDNKQAEIIKQNLGLFNQGGFELQEFGENTLKLVSVPIMCVDLNTKQLFIDLLDAINSVPLNEEEAIKEKFLYTITCRIAEEQVVSISNEEMCKIIDDLFKLPEPFIIGKDIPIATRITRADLEKKFSRRK